MRTFALIAALLLVAPSTGQSARNSKTPPNPTCGFGPGIARWAIKTSVPPEEDPSQAVPVQLPYLISAPNLQADIQTRVAAKQSLSGLNGQMAAATSLTEPQPASSPAQVNLAWAATSSSASRPFTVTVPSLTPPLGARALAYIHTGAQNGEAAPSPFFALLSAQTGDSRLPEPVAIGSNELHEGDFVTTTGYVLASKCEHDDGDFHIDLAASAGGATCAVVEVPNPSYIGQPALRSAVAVAETTASSLVKGDRVTVTGQLFYDMTHGGGASPGGGRGVGRCARSLWEIHPVFKIAVASK